MQTDNLIQQLDDEARSFVQRVDKTRVFPDRETPVITSTVIQLNGEQATKFKKNLDKVINGGINSSTSSNATTP